MLTTSGAKHSSSLVLYDTETRKESKRYPMTSPALDLVKAADGKNLIILEDVNRSKTSGIQFFDTAAFSTVKTSTFRDAAVLDVATQNERVGTRHGVAAQPASRTRRRGPTGRNRPAGRDRAGHRREPWRHRRRAGHGRAGHERTGRRDSRN